MNGNHYYIVLDHESSSNIFTILFGKWSFGKVVHRQTVRSVKCQFGKVAFDNNVLVLNMSLEAVLLSNETILSDEECLKERKWWCFVLSSIFTFLMGVLSVVVVRGLTSFCCRAEDDEFSQAELRRSEEEAKKLRLQGHNPADLGADNNNESDFMAEAKDWAGNLISGQTGTGRILVCLVFILSIASLIIYFIDASSEGVEKCIPWNANLTQQIDLAFNIFFMVYFFIRFIAASDKFFFMLELYSFVDYFTIPPSFVSIYLDRTWIGLRFLRALRLMTVPDILQYLNILKTSTSIRLSQLVSIFISVWLTAAGVIHLLENSGDPPNFDNGQKLNYWDCVYFLMVTMSTVGYGDIYCVTSIGRGFQVLFLLVGLVHFAMHLIAYDIMLNIHDISRGKYCILIRDLERTKLEFV
uniref:BK channel n=1 Tax=Lepeophtheirus salmonis TaxID=72036 RepID=A0A0K2T2W7_LEPSM